MSVLQDLTGQKFGRLTVLNRIFNKSKPTQWLCHCECGQEKVFYANNLIRGFSQSCGCLRKVVLKDIKLQDLVGQTFGRLTVLSLAYRQESNRQYYWLCRCSCGTECVVLGNHLKDGHTQSCGCLNSLGEEKIALLLTNNNILFKKQYSFSDLLGTGGGRLKFDFGIIEEDNLLYLIEYDGYQHEIKHDNSKWDINGSFEQRQYHDKLKDRYCMLNNIPLIRIKSSQYKNLTIEDIQLKEGK